MQPPPCRIIWGTTAWAQMNWPVRLTRSIRSHFSRVVSKKEPSISMSPALFIRKSMLPNSCTTCGTRVSTAAALVMSTGSARAFPPCSAMMAAVS